MSVAEIAVDKHLIQEVSWLKERIRELQEKNEELNLFADMARHFLENLGLQRNLDFLLEKVLQMTKAKTVGIALVNYHYPKKIYYIVKGLNKFRQEIYLPREETPLIDFILNQGQAVILTDKSFLPQRAKHLDKGLPYIGLPLKLERDIIGVLFVENFLLMDMAEDYLNLLRLISGPAVLAIRNSLFQEKVWEQEKAFNQNLVSTYQGIIESLGQGIMAIDNNGIITIFNSELSRILGIGSRAFVGKEFSQAFHWLDSKYWHILDSLEGKSYNNLEYALEIDGREILARVRVRPIYNHEKRIIGGIACWQDISQETKMYRGVAQIGQLAVVGQLAATVAHEIRNPLAAIKGLAQLCQIIPDQEQKRRNLDSLIEEVDYLDNIVREWMDLSRSGKKEVELTEINLKFLLADLIRLLKGKMIMTKISVTSHFVDNFPSIKGNKTLLKQAFLNILINSIQAMNEGGDIYLKGEYKIGEPRVKVVVHDTGGGISRDKLEKVFQPFFTSKRNGTGLGLAVVEQVIVEKHKGKLGIESKESKGTTVTIELPLENKK